MKPQNKHTLPKGWEIKRLENLVFKVGSGITPKGGRETYLTEGVPIVRSQNVTDGRLNLLDVAFISYVQHKKMKATHLKPRDLLLNITGASIGRTCVVPNDFEEGNVNQHVCIIRVNPNKSDPYFLNAFLSSTPGQNLIDSYQAGGGRQGLNFEQIKSFPLPLPPLFEQRQIATVLGMWDRAIEQTTELLKVLRTRHRGLMHHLLTGKKRLPGFEGEWRKNSYDELLKEVKRNVRFDDDELYHLISVRRRSGGLFHRQSLYGHQILTKNLRQAREGDFLFSKMQIVHGASGLTTEEFDRMMISGSYIAVVARDRDVLDIEFFNWLSQLPYFYHQTWVSSYGVHIEKMTFDFEAFLGLSIDIPSTLDEQRTIARVLDASLKEIRQNEAKLEALREQKRGLMQCLLTGQVRVPLPAEMA